MARRVQAEPMLEPGVYPLAEADAREAIQAVQRRPCVRGDGWAGQRLSPSTHSIGPTGQPLSRLRGGPNDEPAPGEGCPLPALVLKREAGGPVLDRAPSSV